VYRQLIENEVDEKYANQIIGEIENSLKKESTVDSILAGIYQKIILKLGQPKPIEANEKHRKIVFFVGPTGVGKTTTIAKLASYFKLEKKIKLALITSDTYRIAAVEQLRTYANILDLPLSVVYTLEEFNMAVKMFDSYDLILVDTAGRSHKNNEQCNEMFHLIEDCSIGENLKKEIYLVLSAATKYKDLIMINDVYKHLKKYNIIFTKLDETTCLGNILNMKLATNVPLSYVTSGQAVPDDIAIIDAQKIARNLLGGNE
ncbi:MAG: flagellar biosynthesis protein FlhF, partial [Lachnospiraceae bacterium]|nr:flagellar biosynthesis protein FlhF [Lachnospiraceae bacterium]